jgi:hypothetical protein
MYKYSHHENIYYKKFDKQKTCAVFHVFTDLIYNVNDLIVTYSNSINFLFMFFVF